MYGITPHIKYGIIDYYLQIENVVYAVIYKIHIIQRNFDFNCNNFSNLFLNNNDLSNIFLKGTVSTERTIILVDSIISKCISINAIKTVVVSKNLTSHSIIKDVVFFSEFISKSDRN